MHQHSHHKTDTPENIAQIPLDHIIERMQSFKEKIKKHNEIPEEERKKDWYFVTKKIFPSKYLKWKTIFKSRIKTDEGLYYLPLDFIMSKINEAEKEIEETQKQGNQNLSKKKKLKKEHWVKIMKKKIDNEEIMEKKIKEKEEGRRKAESFASGLFDF